MKRRFNQLLARLGLSKLDLSSPSRYPTSRHRRRFAFEALEPRMLLSADLLPIDGILEIRGTEEDDSAIIRRLEPQPGAAPQLEVVLNEESFKFDIEDIRSISVELLGGDDELAGESGIVVDWDVSLGEGSDTFFLGATDAAERIDLVGRADSRNPETQIRVEDLERRQVTADFSVDAELIVVDAMGGADQVFLSDADGSVANIAFDIRLGEGDDSLAAIIHSTAPRDLPENDTIFYVIDISGSMGSDIVNYTALDGHDTSQSVFNIAVDLGEGDNVFEGAFTNPQGTLEVRSGAGADTIRTHDRWTGAKDGDHPDFLWLPNGVSGSGNDEVSHTIDIEGAAFPPDLGFDLGYVVDTGDGNDTVAVEYTLFLTSGSPIRSVHMDLDLTTGDGDDSVVLQAVVNGRDSTSHFDFAVDLGRGEGSADADDTGSPWTVVGQLSMGGSMILSLNAETTALDLAIGGSEAPDDVMVDVRGFDDLAVDIDTSAGNDTGNTFYVGTANGGVWKTSMGSGDDLLVHRLAHVVQEDGGAPRSSQPRQFTIIQDLGPGDDISELIVSSEDRVPAEFEIDIDMNAGAGDDSVLINLLVPAVRPVDDLGSDKVHIDLGEGNNHLDLSVLASPPPDDSKPAEFRPAEFHIEDGSDPSIVNLLIDGMLTQVTADLGDGDNVMDMNMIGALPGLNFNVQTGLGNNHFKLSADINANDKLELYEYPGAYAGRFDGVDTGDTVHIDWRDNLKSLDFDLDVRLGQILSLLPEVDDEVLVAFRHADAKAPVLVGLLWKNGATPPDSAGSPPRELHFGVDDGDDALPAVQVDVRGWDLVSKDEIIMEFAGAFGDLDVRTMLRGGDDTIDASIAGAPVHVVLNLDTGDGNDSIDVNISGPIDVVTGAGSGVPVVKAFAGATSSETQSFFAYSPAFSGGVRVATGDVNGDGAADIITGAGPGAGPHVKVFDGLTGAEIRSFFAYAPAFVGGVFVAAGDINGDGFDDIITGVGSGGPHVKVFDGQTGAEIRSFFAFGPGFTGGVRVAAGDVNGDGLADIITGAGPGAGPHVKVFDGLTSAEIRSFFAYDPSFTGGVFVAAGDIDGDGFDDIVTGADRGPAHVKVMSGATGETLHSFFAFEASFMGGVRVAAGDINGDGFDDIIVGAGPGAGPHVKVFDGVTGANLRSFFAYDPAFRGGVYVASGDVDGAEPEPPVFDLTLLTGAGADHVNLTFLTGSNRADSIYANLGSGADSFVLNWHGALQDPAVTIQATLEIDPGGAEATGSGGDDLAQVTFMNGDPIRPAKYSWSYLVRRPRASGATLEVELSSVEGFLDVSTVVEGGSGNDSLNLSFEGKLIVGGNPQSAPPVRALVDMGDGDDQVQIDFSQLSIEGAGKNPPIALDLRGGAGSDALSVIGTEGADKLAVTESTVVLEGVAAIDCEGFAFLTTQLLGGDDSVTMTGINPDTLTTIDGGAGRDRFVGRFDSDDVGRLNLLNFELVKITGGRITLGPLTAQLLSERNKDDEDC